MPKKNQLHKNQLLSNVSVQYKTAAYVWPSVFPSVTVTKDSDDYRVYERNFKIPETKRAPKGLARETGFDFSYSSYLLEQHALIDYVGVDEEENNDQGSLEVDTTENLTDTIYRRIEKTVADLFTTTNWSLNVSLAAANAFTANTTVSDPVPIFDTAATTIIANSGMTPNYGLMPRDGLIACKNHISILDRIKYTQSSLTKEMIASLFGLPELLVPTANYDSAAEGLTPTMANYYGDIAFVGYKPASPGLKVPSAGYTFIHSQPRVRKWFEDKRNATAIEVEIKFQPKVIASLAGYLIKDIL